MWTLCAAALSVRMNSLLTSELAPSSHKAKLDVAAAAANAITFSFQALGTWICYIFFVFEAEMAIALKVFRVV